MTKKPRRSRIAGQLGGATQIRGEGRWFIVLSRKVDPSLRRIDPVSLGLPTDITEEQARQHAHRISAQILTDKMVRPVRSPEVSEDISVRDWYDLWHKWRVEQKIIVNDRHDRGRLDKHVMPLIGDLPIKKVPKSDIQAIVMSLDKKIAEGVISWKTAANIWGNVSKGFSDSSRSKNTDLVVRSDDPTADVLPPNRGEPPEKQFLYPDEFWQLITSPEIWHAPGKRIHAARNALRWMRMFVLNVYLELRQGELRALSWPCFNFDNWVCTIFEAVERDTGGKKTKAPKKGKERKFVVEENLRPLLLVMYEDAKEKTGRVFPVMPPESSLSSRLRKYIDWAKIARPNLFTTTKVSHRLCFRDLRATGITWRAMRGDDPKKIQRAAGHALAQTTDIYIRVAEDIRPVEERAQGASVPPFPPLPEALFGPGGFKSARAAETVWKSRRTSVAFSSHKTGKLSGYRSIAASPAGFEPRDAA